MRRGCPFSARPDTDRTAPPLHPPVIQEKRTLRLHKPTNPPCQPAAHPFCLARPPCAEPRGHPVDCCRSQPRRAPCDGAPLPPPLSCVLLVVERIERVIVQAMPAPLIEHGDGSTEVH